MEKVSLEDSESVGNEQNDENLNDPVEKVSLEDSESPLNLVQLVWPLPGNTCGRLKLQKLAVPLTYVRSCTIY